MDSVLTQLAKLRNTWIWEYRKRSTIPNNVKFKGGSKRKLKLKTDLNKLQNVEKGEENPYNPFIQPNPFRNTPRQKFPESLSKITPKETNPPRERRRKGEKSKEFMESTMKMKQGKGITRIRERVEGVIHLRASFFEAITH